MMLEDICKLDIIKKPNKCKEKHIYPQNPTLNCSDIGEREKIKIM